VKPTDPNVEQASTDQPVVEPVVETTPAPVVETPVVETPVAEAPVTETPAAPAAEVTETAPAEAPKKKAAPRKKKADS
jgi:ribonuclease E